MPRSAPALVRWDVNSKCNLSCKHCCVGENLRDDSIQDLSSAEFMDTIGKMADSGVKALHFLGGEPTIRKDFTDLLRVSNESGLVVSFNTNGIRQDERYLRAILEHNVYKVVVSLDGYDTETHEAIRGKGTFQRTISFIEKLIEKRLMEESDLPIIQIQSVLTSAWASDARKLIELASALGVDSVKVNHLAPVQDAAANIDLLGVDPKTNFFALMDFLDCATEFPELEIDAPIKAKVIQYYRESRNRHIPVDPYSCPAMHDNIYVGPDGEVTPCQLAHAQGMSEGLEPLSIVAEDPEDLWNSPYFDRFAERIQTPDLDNLYRNQVPCNRCIFLGNGCSPCPLPGQMGFYPTNYMCLIAESLLDEAHKAGGHQGKTESNLIPLIDEVIKNNPPRPDNKTIEFDEMPLPSADIDYSSAEL